MSQILVVTQVLLERVHIMTGIQAFLERASYVTTHFPAVLIVGSATTPQKIVQDVPPMMAILKIWQNCWTMKPKRQSLEGEDK